MTRLSTAPDAVFVRPGALILVVALVLCLGLSARASAESSPLYLTWHAPFGELGASDTLSADCDSTHADTLWLAFRPLKPHATFIAFEATLLFHPAPGDSLAGWWFETSGEGVPAHMWMQFHNTPTLGYPHPYGMNGVAAWRLDRLRNDARLRLVYAVPVNEGKSIDAKQYVPGRIVIRHPPMKDARCRQPICIEWRDSRLSWYVGDDVEIVRDGVYRFVSLNSSGGEVALPYRRAARLRAWTPKDQ